jgi:hypothetical protein
MPAAFVAAGRAGGHRFQRRNLETFALSSPRRPIPRHAVFYRNKPRDVLRVRKHFNVMNVMYFNTK